MPEREQIRYMVVVDQLNEKRRQLQTPERLSPETELAETFGVGRDTIRRALEVLEQQGAVTRRRKRGTYLQPMHPSPTGLNHLNIGFVPPWWAESLRAWYTSCVFEGVAAWAGEKECHISVMPPSEHDTDCEKWLAQLRRRNIAGLVWVYPGEHQLELIEYVGRIIPTIIIGRYYPDRGLHHVFPDYQQIADRIDNHLVSMGHHRYAIIGRDIVADYSQVWYQAFSASYARRGQRFLSGDFIDVRPWHIDRLASLLLDHHRFMGKEIQAYVLQTSSHLEPLIADDRFRQKLKGELSIIAFDYGKYPMEAYWPGRTVTHVRTNWSVAARTAMDNLGLLIMNRDVPPAVRLAIDFEPGQTVYPYRQV